MADISAEIAAFKNAIYGEDVRDAMVSLANKLNAVGEDYATLLEQIDNFIDNTFPTLFNTQYGNENYIYPLTVGTITYRGLTIDVYPHNIVHIKGTATGNVRARLTGGLAYSSSIGSIVNTDNVLELEEGEFLSLHTKVLYDNSTMGASGDTASFAFYCLNTETDSVEEIYKLRKSINTNRDRDFIPSTSSYSTYPVKLVGVFLFFLSGEQIDNWTQVQISTTTLDDFNKQIRKRFLNYPIAELPANVRDARFDFTWTLGTYVTSPNTDYGTGSFKINNATNRFITIFPKTYSNPIAIYAPELKWNYRTYPSTNVVPEDRSVPVIIPANTKFGININRTPEMNYYTLDLIEQYILYNLVIYELLPSSDESAKVVLRNDIFAFNYGAAVRKLENASFKTQIAHITDTHGDTQRYINAIQALNYYAPHAIVHTGDIPNNNLKTDTYSYFFENFPDSPLLLAMGNHDTGQVSDVRYSKTNAELLDFWYGPINEHYGFNIQNLYHYYDVRDIRIICLNDYDFDENDGTEFTDRIGLYYSQEQIDWFIQALQGAITNNLSVIVAAHELDKFLPYANTVGPFNVSPEKAAITGVFINETISKKWEGNPICDIIEAFINGERLTRTYDERSDGYTTPPVISVDVAFSTPGKFICWLAGHIHADEMGWIPGYSQLAIRELSTCLGVGSLHSSHYYHDVGRLANTASEDAFNFYAIDTSKKLIDVIRFGANKRMDMAPIEFYRTTYDYQTYLNQQTN